MEKNTPVSEIMTNHLTAIARNTTAAQIRAFFEQNNIHHLPVMDGGKLVGMVSKSDVLQVTHCASLFHSEKDREINEKLMDSVLAEDIMSREIVKLSPTDSVETAAFLFANNKFHALPVVKNGVLVGMITTFDLIEYAYRDHEAPILY